MALGRAPCRRRAAIRPYARCTRSGSRRARGLGVGWVSILDPEPIARILDVPTAWTLVAYLCAGWPQQAPFDRILLSCAVETVPPILIEQLKPGGILIAPVGSVPKSDAGVRLESFSQRLTKIVRTETGVVEDLLIPVVFVPMLPGLP